MRKKFASVLVLAMLAVGAYAVPPASAYATKQVIGGDLIITGGNGFDEVFVVALGNDVYRVGYYYYFPNPAPGDPIDELRWDDFFGVTGDVIVDLNNGYNWFTFSDGSGSLDGVSGAVHYEGGTGNDRVSIADAHIPGRVSVSTGASGSDNITLAHVKIRQEVQIETSGSSTTIADAVFGNTVEYVGSGAGETVTVEDSSFYGDLIVETFAGHDSVTIQADRLSHTKILMGSGNDDLGIYLQSTRHLRGPLSVDGGRHTDTLEVTPSPKIAGYSDFEAVS